MARARGSGWPAVNAVPAPRSVERFRSLVAESLGLAFDDSKLALLAESLQRRIEVSGGDAEVYWRILSERRRRETELRAFAAELTVTETYFYRHADQIRAFIELALPGRLAACAGLRKVRVLSAGCASGEEPYSLAIAIREFAPAAADAVTIAAVDVNAAMLEKARRGHYTAWSLRELPDELRARWFRPSDGGFALDAALRRTVAFEERNLAPDDAELWRPQSWDIVFCRNVMMYFEQQRASVLVGRIARALAPGGFLFLGHAETLRGLSEAFHLRHTHGAFYYQVKEEPDEREALEPPAPQVPSSAPLQLCDTASWVEAVRGASDRINALAEASRSRSHDADARAPRRAPDLRPALELVHGERFGQALAELDALPSEHARQPEALLLRAVSAVHSGALSLAQSACRDLLAHDELSAGAHYVLALCHEGLGDLEQALQEDQIALHLDQDFAMARLHAGLIARRRGEREAARRELARALQALRREDMSRLLLFGGGFGRAALVALCRTELEKCGGGA